jgi:N-acetylmuramoyl-L-alanine amidase
MEPKSLRIRTDRQAILKGVYEDNLRTVKPDAAPAGAPEPSPGASARRPRWAPTRFRLLLAMFGMFVMLTGILYQGFDAGPFLAGAPLGAAAQLSNLDLPLLDSAEAAGLLPAPDSLAFTNPTVARLYGLQLKTIVIDPGHGGIDPGAIGRRGLKEKDITLDVARRLRARLIQHPGYRILLTRETDSKQTLRDRIAFANAHKADLFISLHVNSVADEAISPIETYYYGPGSDARATRLAEQENHNSGYSVAEFNELTRQLGLELKIEESKEVAVSIQKGLYRNMRRIDAKVSDWGARAGDFMVLLGVQAPSVLAEIASISNRAAETQLSTAAHRERLAMFLEEGIVGYLRQHANETQPTEHATSEAEE